MSFLQRFLPSTDREGAAPPQRSSFQNVSEEQLEAHLNIARYGSFVLTDAVRRRVTDPRPVNLAFGTRVSLLELIALLEQQLGRPLERTHADTRPGDVRDSQADQSALRWSVLSGPAPGVTLPSVLAPPTGSGERPPCSSSPRTIPAT